jgi:hypothetical protein
MAPHTELYLGARRALNGTGLGKLEMPTHHLVTHGVVVGMTGSGKTGLLSVLLEEAARARIPSLVIDVKGDLPNLLLAFSNFESAPFVPWAASLAEPNDDRSVEAIARAFADERKASLCSWGISEAMLKAYVSGVEPRVLTPGSSAGEPLHMLSGLERGGPSWTQDPEAARASLSAAVSLLLRLVGRDADPARSKEHALLCALAERRLRAAQSAELSQLIGDLQAPPIERIGALDVDEFVPKRDRSALAASLNTLLASSTFASWREGASLDIASWLTPTTGRTPLVIVSVAHLDDLERALVLGVLLEEVLTWMRSLSGSRRLRALIAFDEVYGFLPPHPANPPTKAPLVALLKQARAFGVGVLVATQNPMDLDYRALSNAGLWCIGRLQTDADRARVVDGLQHAWQDQRATPDLDRLIQRLAPRWFLMRDAHDPSTPLLLQPRWAMSFLRGPMTRAEIQRARAAWVDGHG